MTMKVDIRILSKHIETDEEILFVSSNKHREILKIVIWECDSWTDPHRKEWVGEGAHGAKQITLEPTNTRDEMIKQVESAATKYFEQQKRSKK